MSWRRYRIHFGKDGESVIIQLLGGTKFCRALMFKSRAAQPEFELWHDFHYEHEPTARQPIDVINGEPSFARVGR